MEKFYATKVNDKVIELTSLEQLEKLLKIIEKEEDFILQWDEGTVKQSKIIISNNIRSKIKTGDLELMAKEGLGGKKK